MESDAAVTLFLPERYIINCMLSHQYCRYGAVKLSSQVTSRAGSTNVSSVACLCICIIFVQSFISLVSSGLDLFPIPLDSLV